MVANQNAMDSVCPDDGDNSFNAARNQTSTTEEPLIPEEHLNPEGESKIESPDPDLDEADKQKNQMKKIIISKSPVHIDSLDLNKKSLYVSDLARKSPEMHAKKATLYYLNLITMAIFYGLPVIQLAMTYQDVTRRRNQDLCYFNFLCRNPFGRVTDFNHAFSNIGYVMLGILFIFIVKRRKCNFEKLGLEHHRTMGKKHALRIKFMYFFEFLL